MPATNSGEIYAFDAGPGIGPQDVLTQAGFSGQDDSPRYSSIVRATSEEVASTGQGVTPKVNYLWYILGIFILLVAMKYAGHKASKSNGTQPALAGVGVYNFVVIGIMSMLFLLTGKVILNKYPVKGLTELFNAA